MTVMPAVTIGKRSEIARAKVASNGIDLLNIEPGSVGEEVCDNAGAVEFYANLAVDTRGCC